MLCNYKINHMRKLGITLVITLAAGLQLFSQTGLAKMYNDVKSSVVTIYVAEVVNPGYGDPKTMTSNMGMGSGVLVREDMVLTAAHVVGNATRIMVEFLDGESIEAATIRISNMADVALIKLDKAPANPNIATIGESDQVEIGDDVFVVGAPMGLTHSVSKGIISGRHSEQYITSGGNMLEFFQTDAAINTGNSGGPMFNAQGEVIGIVSSILSRSGGFEGIGFAATSEIARSLLLKRSGKYFGAGLVMLPYELARIFNVPQESGLLVQSVAINSPADIAGVKGGFLKINVQEEELMIGGDIILAIDGIRITDRESFEQLMKHLDSVEATYRHKIEVLRAGEIIELSWVSTSID